MQSYEIIVNGISIDTIIAHSLSNAIFKAHQRNYPAGFIVR